MNERFACATTLNEVLQLRAEFSASTNWLTFYKKDRIESKLSFEQLYRGAQCWSAALFDQNVRPGDRVLLILPTEKAFYEAFWGILETGAIPVPLYPPARIGQMDEYLLMLTGIAADCGTSVLITNSLVAPLLHSLKDHQISLLIANQVSGQNPIESVRVKPTDIALLQYTSGSTGSQKGVMLNHDNLLSNIRAMGKRLKPSSQDVAFSWLPLYHDMGLIGLMIGSIYYGVPLIAMSPIDFLRKPIRWIHLMSLHRATITAAPNFAYNLLARKAKNQDLEKIDLSNLRIALCGAEPIHVETIDNFIRRFKPVGFSPKAFFPAYGLAENSLAVSFSETGKPPTVKYFNKRILEMEGKAVEQSLHDGGSAMVSVGCPLDTVEFAILNNKGIPLGPNIQGEVAIKGPSVTQGYYNNRQATINCVSNGWFLTGDLGFVADGQLYISGRRKDMIIRAGRNYFAEDLEATVSSLPGIRPGGLCVFGTKNHKRGTEEVVVLVESATNIDSGKLVTELKRKMSISAGFRPDVVQVVPPRTLPKTSSGKLQRFKARQRYLDGNLNRLGKEGKLQNLWVYMKALLKAKFLN